MPIIRGGIFSFFLWQRWARLIFLARIGPLGQRRGALVGLLVKRALPPFIWWFVPLAEKWSLLSWVWFLRVAKVVPLILLSYLSFPVVLPLLGALTSLGFLLQNLSWKHSILSSSIRDRSWIIAAGIQNFTLLIFFILIYVVSWLGWAANHSFIGRQRAQSKIFLLIMLGLPPSVFFVIKLRIIIIWSSIRIVILAARGLFLLIIYFRWFYSSSLTTTSTPINLPSWIFTFNLTGIHLGWVSFFA